MPRAATQRPGPLAHTASAPPPAWDVFALGRGAAQRVDALQHRAARRPALTGPRATSPPPWPAAAQQAGACVALCLARSLVGTTPLWRTLEALSLAAAAPLQPLRALVPGRLAAALAPLARPLLLLRLLGRCVAAALPDTWRTARLWAHLLPIYSRYRLTAWRARRALQQRQRRRGDAAAPASAADSDGAEAAAAALWERTHEWGGGAVYAMVLDLGGYYVKTAQILASKGEFLPPAWTHRLGALWDAMPPRPWRALRPALQQHLARCHRGGTTLHDAFAAVDHTPLAAASIAQVHAATLRRPHEWAPPDADDATSSSSSSATSAVVLKVQHCGVEALMAADLRNLGAVARFLRPVLPFDITPIVAEIQASIPKEFDFAREVRLQTAIRRRLAAAGLLRQLAVPRAVAALCTRGLVVMERLEGTPLSRLVRPPPPDDVAAAATWHAQRRAARDALPALAAAYGRMLLRDGLVHADPHPGNLLLCPDGRLALLDFGQCKALPAAQRVALSHLMLALAADDAPAIAAALAGAGFRFVPTGGGAPSLADVALLGAIIFDTRPLKEAQGADANPLTSPLLARNSLGGAGGSGFNGELYMVVRALTLLRSLCFALGADISMAAIWADDAREALRETPQAQAARDAENAALEALDSGA